MAKANDTWKVLPHGPLERLADGLWRVQGDLEGMPLERVMTIARRADGRLVIHNAMALDDASMRELEALGPVGFLVVPNGYHRLDAKVFHERYPDAKVVAPAGSRRAVEEVVKVDLAYPDVPADEAVSFEHLAGTGDAEGVMTVRSGGEVSLVLNDAVFNCPHGSGFTGFVLRYLTASTGGPRVSRVARWFLVKDKAAFRAHLERLAATPGLARVVVSHHEVIAERPAEVLREVAATV